MDPPTVTAGALREAPGGLTLELEVEDPGDSCGVAEVRAVVGGAGVRFAVEPEMADDDGDGVWRGSLSSDRCGTTGEVWVIFVSVRDRAGNEREFRPVMGEEFLQATDRDVELLIPSATLRATRSDPRIVDVRAADEGGLAVDWEGEGCGDVRWSARAGGETLREGARDPACLPEGPTQVTEVLLVAPGGGGDTRFEGLPSVQVVGSGLSERLPVEIDRLGLAWLGDGLAQVEVALREPGCEVLSMEGRLQRLHTGDPVRRVAYFGDDGVAEIPGCAGDDGVWWLAHLELRDRSGGRWEWRLRTDRPELGYREDPDLEAPALRRRDP